VTPWLKDRLATPLVRNGKNPARRFSPFNFSVVPGFPNVVPTPNEWVDYFPIFREHKEDNPAQHLHEFHELMLQWEIHHEDVLMKMFMFSLAGDAREWYQSLPPASISSLGEFHAAFNRHCQRYYSSEFIVIIVVRNVKAMIKIWLCLMKAVRMRTMREMKMLWVNNGAGKISLCQTRKVGI
jgi:hypothetical protein